MALLYTQLCTNVISSHTCTAQVHAVGCWACKIYWLQPHVQSVSESQRMLMTFFEMQVEGIRHLQHTDTLQLSWASLNSSEISERASCASQIKDSRLCWRHSMRLPSLRVTCTSLIKPTHESSWWATLNYALQVSSSGSIRGQWTL